MMAFFHLLMPFLLIELCGRIVASDCPQDCSCSTAETIFCFQRRSATMPQGVSALTKNIYLFANGIESLTEEDFVEMESLEMLDLSQNKLTELPDRVFETLTSLRNLDLSANQITYLSEESFSGMALLERLYLYSNHIQTIHPAAFQGLNQLLELKLQGNQLTTLPVLAMPRLLLLDLRFNTLSSPGTKDLQTPNLESLKLAGLGLESLDEELMASLGNLHELDISGNKLSSFPPALREARGLIHLSLAENPMGPLKLDDLQNLGELQELDISNLSLQTLPEGFSLLFPYLNRLTVAENPFNCLCTMAWFPRWLRNQGITLGRTEETRCHFPPLNSGKVLERLEHREFGCPTTTTVTASTTRTTTTTSTPPTVTTLPSTTPAIPAAEPSDENTSVGTDSQPLPPVPASPSSSSQNTEVDYLCPSQTCLNGGTCRLDRQGQLECTCLRGFSGSYCEIRHQNIPRDEDNHDISAATVTPDATDISSRKVTSTSILLDLHRYIEKRTYIQGIRLTYRNLSGPDQRPMHLSVPASYPEYTLRGLRPNSTYTVCASPLNDPTGGDRVCTKAHTAMQLTVPGKQVEGKRLTTMLMPALAILLLLVLVAAAVGVVCYLRRKRAKGHLDLHCEPSLLELEGVKSGSDNGGVLPQKHLEPAVVQNGGLEYEVLLIQDHMQDHCTANNNTTLSHKPSYF
ncbi:hypothetical protein DPEC_G00303250 [Dallia pectoralis]|uniref:Uncharacterized protein n=1 Tax=Dallia pectoralis TaxID=75939 RepID=A0ACC2FDB9_DALPE|nr:hypothetical protein DPEC_G00303250 [Dallia pectoralis]